MEYVSSFIEIPTDDGRIASVDVTTITLMVRPTERGSSGKTKIYHHDGFMLAGMNRDQVVELVEKKRRELWEAQQSAVNKHSQATTEMLIRILATLNQPKTIEIDLNETP